VEHFLNLKRESGHFKKVALFLTMLIRFPWTDLLLASKYTEFRDNSKGPQFCPANVQCYNKRNIEVLGMLLNILSVYDTEQH
jgi:hypothetical protein